jgi:peptide deformylase
MNKIKLALLLLVEVCFSFTLRASLALRFESRRNLLAEAAAPFLFRKEAVVDKEEWIEGTEVPHLSPLQALERYACNEVLERSRSSGPTFPMAKWPDPVLRIPAGPVSAWLWNTDTLFTLADILRQTARQQGAVGLAAQQCGVDIALIFIDSSDKKQQQRKGLLPPLPPVASLVHHHLPNDGVFLLNPRFVYRSPETEMMAWNEQCLVMPPKFQATVLRDRRVVMEFETLDGSTTYLDVAGESARVVQHECQHNDGILIVDHVDLDHDELVTNQMRLIEHGKHMENQRRAFARPILEPKRQIGR